MSNETKKTALPKLRFPEFQEASEWEEKALGKIGKFTGGGTPSKGKGDFWQGSIPWVSSSDISEDSIHQVKVTRFITEEALKESATKLVPENSILLVSRVGVGKLAITTQSVCTSQDFTNFTPAKDALVFLAYYLKMQNQLLLSFSQGMAIKGFTKEDVSTLKLFLPSFSEQQKIAATLSSLDDLITAQNAKLAALQAHKRGLMQGLFPAEGETVPKLRFPEFQEAGEWDGVGLKKIAQKIMVGIASAATHAYRKAGIVLFRNQNIKGGHLDDSDILFIDEEYEKAHKNKRLKSGDILIARTGYPGTACVVPDKYEGSQSFTTLIVRPNRKLIDSSFLSLYINSEQGKAFFDSAKIGGGQQNVNAGSLAEMPIPYPSLAEQEKIADCLSFLNDRITAQNQKIEALKLHKKGLMQNLFPAAAEPTA